eukprot:7521808-Prorocentrum_lima.AAC.1
MAQSCLRQAEDVAESRGGEYAVHDAFASTAVAPLLASRLALELLLDHIAGSPALLSVIRS